MSPKAPGLSILDRIWGHRPIFSTLGVSLKASCGPGRLMKYFTGLGFKVQIHVKSRMAYLMLLTSLMLCPKTACRVGTQNRPSILESQNSSVSRVLGQKQGKCDKTKIPAFN